MPDPRSDDSPADRQTLAEFFAESDRPATEQSRFTPQDVATLVRQDRDASN